MNLLRAGFIEKINRFPKLCAADNGIINKQQFLPLYQFGYGYLLHLGNLIANVLICRRK